MTLAWRALVVFGSVLLGAALWLLPLQADASQMTQGSPTRVVQQCPPSTVFPPDPQCRDTTTTERSTTTTTAPPVTEPPVTQPPATEPPAQPRRTTTTEEEQPDDEEAAEPVTSGGPLQTTANLLVEGDGTSGAQATTTTSTPNEGGGSSADDRRRLIWMIIAGLGAVALLVALLTWRYWLLTRPGLDLGDEDEDPDGPGPSGPPDDGRMAARGRGRRDARPAATMAGAPAGAWAPPVGAPPAPPGPGGPGGPGGRGFPGPGPGPGPGEPTMAAPPPLAPPDGGSDWPDPRGIREPAGRGMGGGGRGPWPDGSEGGGRRTGPPPGGQAFVEPPPGGQAFVEAPDPSRGSGSPRPGPAPRRSAAAPGRRSADRPGEPLNPSAFDDGPARRARRSGGSEASWGRGRDRDPFGWDDEWPDPQGHR